MEHVSHANYSLLPWSRGFGISLFLVKDGGEGGNARPGHALRSAERGRGLARAKIFFLFHSFVFLLVLLVAVLQSEL
jgi:hypothetical protein